MKAKMNRLNMMESGRGVAPNQTGAVLPRDKLQVHIGTMIVRVWSIWVVDVS